MNTLIISAIIFVLYSVITLISRDKVSEKIGNIFGSIFIIGILYGVVMFIGNLELRNNPKYTKYEYKELPIQSLINKGGLSVNGSFVLGSGSVTGRDRDYYVSYAQFPLGLLRVKIDASNTYIRETDVESPKIINYWVREVWTGYENKWFWNSAPVIGEWEENKYGEKIVVVPKNTVYKDLFKIED